MRLSFSELWSETPYSQPTRAETVNAEYHLRREHDRGSISAGKLADFVQLSADPYAVNPAALSTGVAVLATWSNGVKVNAEAFISDIAPHDPADHQALTKVASRHKCC